MLNTEDIRNKEVINIYVGKSMGFVCDIEINLKEGRIDGIVLPGDKGFMKIFGKETKGLPEEIVYGNPERAVRIPMREGLRSLNLANSVAIAAYEAARQMDFPELK